MKRIILISLLAGSMSFAFAQEEEIEVLLETNITMVSIEIDSSQFIKKAYNNYWLKDGKGLVSAHTRDVSYEDIKTHMGTRNLGLITIVEEKEITLNGITFLYAKQEQNRAGQMVEMISYIKKYDKQVVIEVGAVYPKGEEDKYKTIVEKAAISAKVIEQ